MPTETSEAPSAVTGWVHAAVLRAQQREAEQAVQAGRGGRELRGAGGAGGAGCLCRGVVLTVTLVGCMQEARVLPSLPLYSRLDTGMGSWQLGQETLQPRLLLPGLHSPLHQAVQLLLRAKQLLQSKEYCTELLW